MYNDVLRLVKLSTTTNEYGDKVDNSTKKEVFCSVSSIGQSEFYQAQTQGLKPEIKFILADYYEYDNEQYVEYSQDGTTWIRYKILRTYIKGNEIEITCYGGVRNAST